MHHRSSSKDSNQASHTACLQGHQHCFPHPGTPPMGAHHPQLHCQLFTMETGALPQVMPQTTCRHLSQLAGDYTCLGKQDHCWKPYHTLASEQRSVQGGIILPPVPPAAPASRAHSSASPTARAAGSWHGKMLHLQANAAPRTEGCSWPCAAAPQRHQLLLLLHRKGFLTGLNFRAWHASHRNAL